MFATYANFPDGSKVIAYGLFPSLTMVPMLFNEPVIVSTLNISILFGLQFGTYANFPEGEIVILSGSGLVLKFVFVA